MRPSDPDDLFDQAVEHHQKGLLTEAVGLYEAVIALDPQRVSAHFNRGLALQSLNKTDDALQSYDRVLVLDPNDGEVHYCKATALRDMNRLDEAIASCDRAVVLKPDFAEAYFERGNLFRHLGRVEDAVRSYDQTIVLNPDHAAAYNNRGNLLKGLGRLDEALASFDQAIALQPELPELHNNRGTVLASLGRFSDALASYDRAIALRPDYAEAHNNRTKTLSLLSRREDTSQSPDTAIAQSPDSAEAYNRLGIALLAQGRFAEAVENYKKALTLKPDYVEVRNDLGIALMALGRFAEAAESYTAALALKPDYVEVHNNLGAALMAQGKFAEAVESYKKALTLKPDFARVHNNLGNAYKDQGKLAEAVESYKKALTLQPDCADFHSNLGGAYSDQGKLVDAVDSYKRALAIKPDYGEAHSNLLMTLHYSGNLANEDILANARQFAARFEKPAAVRPFANDPGSDRRLRVGYVSADFRSHPVGYFLGRVLPSHDHSSVEVFCYSNSTIHDAMTDHLRQAADHWRSIAGVSDADAASLIWQDEIDILVDLSGHTASNRLPLFALRPAPVQVSWLGYFGTTGLTAINYILADRQVVSEGDERYFTENIWRLPGCYLCYAPHPFDIAVAPPPMESNGFVTFGCFNNRMKITEATIEVWAQVLSSVPGSRLFLKAASLSDATVRGDLRDQFAAHGVSADRLLLEGQSPLAEALLAYNRVDVALDPFPFGGCTTTAECLWMGVPVVALRGDRWVGRMSASILSAIGHPELVAESVGGYVENAVALGTDLSRLAELRAGLRSRLENSSFCDGPRFTRELEAAYHGMWQAWCQSHSRIPRQ